MFCPICLYSIAKREGVSGPEPGIPYTPIIVPQKMIQQTPYHGVAYFNWMCEAVNHLKDAIYVVHPNTVPPPPGFQWFAGNPPATDTALWRESASVISEAMYAPAPTALPRPTRPTPQLSPTACQSEILEPEELVDQMRLTETAEGYVLIPAKAKRKLPASNYIIREVAILHCIFADEARNKTAVQLTLHVISSRIDVESIEIPLEGLDTVVSRIGKAIPTAIAFPQSKAVFSNLLPVLVRERLTNCQHIYAYQDSGWVLPPHCQWIYAHADAVPPSDHVKIETDFQFGFSENGPAPGWLVQNSWRLLSLSKDLATILIPFLYAHLSLIWTLFDAAGYPPHVLLFIKGVTGSLKTAVASLLFNFSAEPKNNIPASFRDTSASTEVKMGEYKDRVLLVDDFCPAASENARRILEQNLEQLIRFYGDGIAKARTNPKLEKTHEKRPHGLCAITGEDSAGSYSSLLRCLFITVQPDTYDKVLLADFQDNPAFWTEYLKVFVDFCTKSAEGIISFVKAQFPVLRNRAAQVIVERRLVDAYACLSLTAEIVLNFAAPHLGMSDNDKAAVYARYDAAVLETCRCSAEEAKEVDPVQVFARLVCEGIDKQTLLLTGRQEFEATPNEFHGYIDGNYWYFWPHELFDFLRRAYELGGKKFPLTQVRLWEALYLAKILVPAVPRGAGEHKFEYGVRVSFGNRPRMIRIDPVMLKKSL